MTTLIKGIDNRVRRFLFQVPFQDALDLVRTRKVYLRAGYAYIPHQDIVTIVLNDFRTRLSKALAVCFSCQIFSLFPWLPLV